MRQLLINIFLFFACITLFCLAAPQVPSTDKHGSNIEPIKTAPKDSTSMLWKKDSTFQATAELFSKKTLY